MKTSSEVYLLASEPDRQDSVSKQEDTTRVLNSSVGRYSGYGSAVFLVWMDKWLTICRTWFPPAGYDPFLIMASFSFGLMTTFTMPFARVFNPLTKGSWVDEVTFILDPAIL